MPPVPARAGSSILRARRCRRCARAGPWLLLGSKNYSPDGELTQFGGTLNPAALQHVARHRMRQFGLADEDLARDFLFQPPGLVLVVRAHDDLYARIQQP